MITSTDVKLFSTLALILAVAISPLSSTAFAEDVDKIEVDEEVKVDQVKIEGEDKNADKKRIKEDLKKLREQLGEERKQLRDQYKNNPQEIREQMKQLKDAYKDKIRAYINDIRPHIVDRPYDGDRSDVNGEPDISFYGSATGWAILGGKAYDATISLEGKASHISNGVWKVYSTGTIIVSGHEAVLDLNGFTRSGHIMLHGTGTLVGSDGEQDIRVQLRGNYAPIAESDNEFAIAFTNAVVHNIDTGHRIPLSLVGSIMVERLGPEPESVESEVADMPELTAEILS